MTAETITNAQEQALTALERYRFLTSQQIVECGGATSYDSARTTLRALVRRKIVGRVEFGFRPAVGRVAAIHYLTEKGADLLATGRQDGLEINYPKKVTVFSHDYAHRIATVDFHILLYQWCEANEATLDFFHAYYDRGNAQKQERTRISVEIAPNKHTRLVPDALFAFTATDGIQRLFALEVQRTDDTRPHIRKLKDYQPILLNDGIEEHFNFPDRVRLLVVFDDEKILQRVQARATRENLDVDVSEQIFFSTLATLKADFIDEWQSLEGLKTPLF